MTWCLVHSVAFSGNVTEDFTCPGRFRGWFGGRFLIKAELRKLVRKRVRENHVKTIVKKKATLIPASFFFHKPKLCIKNKCLWSFSKAFFFKQNSRKFSLKFSRKFSCQNSHTKFWHKSDQKPPPKPPLKRPGPLKSSVTFPEKVAECTTHDSGHPAPRSSDVEKKNAPNERSAIKICNKDMQ